MQKPTDQNPGNRRHGGASEDFAGGHGEPAYELLLLDEHGHAGEHGGWRGQKKCRDQPCAHDQFDDKRQTCDDCRRRQVRRQACVEVAQ